MLGIIPTIAKEHGTYYDVVIEVICMTTIVISEKGQVTLPADIRRKLGLAAHSRLQVEVRDDQVVLSRVKTVAELAGILAPYARPGITWEQEREQMEKAIAEEGLDLG